MFTFFLLLLLFLLLNFLLLLLFILDLDWIESVFATATATATAADAVVVVLCIFGMWICLPEQFNFHSLNFQFECVRVCDSLTLFLYTIFVFHSFWPLLYGIRLLFSIIIISFDNFFCFFYILFINRFIVHILWVMLYYVWIGIDASKFTLLT